MKHICFIFCLLFTMSFNAVKETSAFEKKTSQKPHLAIEQGKNDKSYQFCDPTSVQQYIMFCPVFSTRCPEYQIRYFQPHNHCQPG